MSTSKRSSTAKSRPPTKPAPVPSTRLSPVLLASVAAVVVGLVIVALLLVAGGLPGSQTSAAIATPMFPTPTDHADGRSLGVADAPLQIDLYADFQCPICARFTEQIEPFLVSRYVEPGKARLTFHDMTFIGPESFDAAVAARVAEAQGGDFWPMHDLIYANQGAENAGALARGRLADMAVRLGLDRTAFLAAMDDPSYLAAVKDETAQSTKAGVTATPTLIVGGQLITGLPDLVKLETYLDGLLGAGSPAPS